MSRSVCAECGKPIPASRAKNGAITCSSECAKARFKKQHALWTKRHRSADVLGVGKHGGYKSVEVVVNWRSRSNVDRVRNDVFERAKDGDARVMAGMNEAGFGVKGMEFKNADERVEVEEA